MITRMTLRDLRIIEVTAIMLHELKIIKRTQESNLVSCPVSQEYGYKKAKNFQKKFQVFNLLAVQTCYSTLKENKRNNKNIHLNFEEKIFAALAMARLTNKSSLRTVRNAVVVNNVGMKNFRAMTGLASFKCN